MVTRSSDAKTRLHEMHLVFDFYQMFNGEVECLMKSAFNYNVLYGITHYAIEVLHQRMTYRHIRRRHQYHHQHFSDLSLTTQLLDKEINYNNPVPMVSVRVNFPVIKLADMTSATSLNYNTLVIPFQWIERAALSKVFQREKSLRRNK